MAGDLGLEAQALKAGPRKAFGEGDGNLRRRFGDWLVHDPDPPLLTV